MTVYDALDPADASTVSDRASPAILDRVVPASSDYYSPVTAGALFSEIRCGDPVMLVTEAPTTPDTCASKSRAVVFCSGPWCSIVLHSSRATYSIDVVKVCTCGSLVFPDPRDFSRSALTLRSIHSARESSSYPTWKVSSTMSLSEVGPDIGRAPTVYGASITIPVVESKCATRANVNVCLVVIPLQLAAPTTSTDSPTIYDLTVHCYDLLPLMTTLYQPRAMAVPRYQIIMTLRRSPSGIIR